MENIKQKTQGYKTQDHDMAMLNINWLFFLQFPLMYYLLKNATNMN